MDQNELRQLESQCIQEHAPECTAACPLHVDVRGMMAAAAREDFSGALKILRKTNLFPGVTGHLCDQPCRPVCKRSDAGGALSIAALERACTALGGSPETVRVLPGRGQRVAVIGAGISSLAASFDLVRKGYAVTVYEAASQPGGRLRLLPPDILPTEVLNADLDYFTRFNIEFVYNCPAGEGELALDALLERFQAVYIGAGTSAADVFGFTPQANGCIGMDPLTYMTERQGVFGGGSAVHHNPVRFTNMESQVEVQLPLSVVTAISDGRRAANSIDRYLQRVSLTAARGFEGAYQTRLFTSMEGIEPLPVVPMSSPENGYTAAEAAEEARRCIQCECMECVKVCEYLKEYGGYPKRYLREVYNNLSIVKGERIKNQFINSCSLCGLCAEICPENLDFGTVCHEARQLMVQERRMPPSAHDFALRDMAFSNSQKFAFARSASVKNSRYAFFPGCQLAASKPGAVERLYRLLRESTNPEAAEMGLIFRCCGAPADWAGQKDLLEETRQQFMESYESMGRPCLVLACSSCYATFKQCYPDVEFVSLWVLLEQWNLLPSVKPLAGPVAVHDPCSTRYETEIHQSVRNILQAVGVAVEELKLSREKTECCSYGGLVWLANTPLSQNIIQRRIQESELDYVTYCAMCRDFFARQGKRTLHLLDLFFDPEHLEQQAQQPGPDYSQRHENRARLKQSLLRAFWPEEIKEDIVLDSEMIELNISEAVRQRMEERLILVEDIQQVIAYAEKTGAKLFNRSSGHYLVSYRPNCVTYWVEYTKENEVFIIHNTYSHRMLIGEGVKP